jgi:hypothetical protein
MLTNEAELVVSVWEVIRDSVPHNKRADIARDLLYVFSDYGFEPAELASVVDEDPDLAEAFEEVFPSTDLDDEEMGELDE